MRKYDYFLDESLELIFKNGEKKVIKIDELLLDRAYSRVIKIMRNRWKDFDNSDDFVLREYVSETEFENAMKSVAQLNKGNGIDKEVKFDDVRNMSLGLDNLEGYTDAEKSFVQERLSDLAEDFNLEKSTDKFLAWRVALCELKIMQLETLSVMNKKEAADAQKQIEILDKQYKLFCESLNALKRQRDNVKEKPKEVVDLTGNINKLDKSIDELKNEINKEREQEREMIIKLNKKKC